MKRRESKYVISLAEREQLEAEITNHLEPNRTYGAEGRFPIICQYFDSLHRDCYWERMRKMKSRRKVWVRRLGEDGTAIPPVTLAAGRYEPSMERTDAALAEGLAIGRLADGRLRPLR